tara:strand:+ start:1899 stop:2828 length:930 start_codon:yes stop_codon:yes gene_type:complete
MDIIRKLNKIDSRIIYLLISIVVIIPLLFDFPVSITPDKNATTLYDSLDEILKQSDSEEVSSHSNKSIKSNEAYYYNSPASNNQSSGNKKILLSFDYGPSTKPEVAPMSYAIMKQIIESGNEVHTMALWDTGLPMITETKRAVLNDLNIDEKDVKIYNFGFKTGGESVIKGMLTDIGTTFPQSKGMVDVEDLCDYDFIISFSAGSPGAKEWVQFGGDQSKSSCGKKVKVSTGVTAVQVTELLPYITDDEDSQLTGMLAGATGGASYEALMGEPGQAHQRMNAQSWTHALIIILIIIGNISHFILNKRKS